MNCLKVITELKKFYFDTKNYLLQSDNYVRDSVKHMLYAFNIIPPNDDISLMLDLLMVKLKHNKICINQHIYLDQYKLYTRHIKSMIDHYNIQGLSDTETVEI